MLPMNPMLWGKGGGSYSAADASNEMNAVYTDHIPVVLAGVAIGAGVLLIVLDRAGFAFSGAAKAGFGRG